MKNVTKAVIATLGMLTLAGPAMADWHRDHGYDHGHHRHCGWDHHHHRRCR